MPLQFTVSPDFSPEHLSGWYIFNTWLQKQTDQAIHLELFDSFEPQREAVRHNKVDLIYANPFDAAMLVREKGFSPLVKAVGMADEAIVAVSADNPASKIEQLTAGINIAVTDVPDVRMMGMIMLEPGDLTVNNVNVTTYKNYVLIAKQLIQGNSDVGIFLASAYDDLSGIIKSQLKVLVRSQISVIYHALMLAPTLSNKKDELLNLLIAMPQDEKGKNVLNSLGFTGWEKVNDEEMEFMIDLMDTLTI